MAWEDTVSKSSVLIVVHDDVATSVFWRVVALCVGRKGRRVAVQFKLGVLRILLLQQMLV